MGWPVLPALYACYLTTLASAVNGREITRYYTLRAKSRSCMLNSIIHHANISSEDSIVTVVINAPSNSSMAASPVCHLSSNSAEMATKKDPTPESRQNRPFQKKRCVTELYIAKSHVTTVLAMKAPIVTRPSGESKRRDARSCETR